MSYLVYGIGEVSPAEMLRRWNMCGVVRFLHEPARRFMELISAKSAGAVTRKDGIQHVYMMIAMISLKSVVTAFHVFVRFFRNQNALLIFSWNPATAALTCFVAFRQRTISNGLRLIGVGGMKAEVQ